MGWLRELRVDILPACAEFLGTMWFLLFAFGGVQAAKSATAATTTMVVDALSVEEIQFIATAFGLGLLVAAWSFYRVSGSVFNPAVSLALWLVGVLRFQRFCLYFIAEIAGGIAASAVINGIVPGSLKVGNSLSPGVTHARGVLLEMLGTSALVLTVLFLAAEKSRATPFAPVGIGLSLFSIHLFLVPFTGCGINPARSFGPAVISGFESTQWVFWIGPITGALLSSLLYIVLKYFNYERLNAGQDSVHPEDSPDTARLGFKASISSLRRKKEESTASIPTIVHPHDVEQGVLVIGQYPRPILQRSMQSV